MKRFLKHALGASCIVLLAACSSLPQSLLPQGLVSAKTVTGKDNVTGQVVGKVDSSSKFLPLQIGMTRKEVEQLLGRPTDLAAQGSDSGWLPYYFGSDTWSTESCYRGEGRLVFNTESRLVLIDVSENARK
jgi:outer membrane protein assembly factor BamE (lipoprotein component of BamABCDE complex)